MVVSSNAIVIHFVWKLMIQCSFLYVPSNTDISPANNFSRSGPTWHPSAESYLHGHNVKGSKFNDHMDGGGSSSSSDECGMVRGKCKIRTVQYVYTVIYKTCYISYCIWALLNVVWVEVSIRLAQSSNMQSRKPVKVHVGDVDLISQLSSCYITI